MKYQLIVGVLLVNLGGLLIDAYIVDYGPTVKATKGEIWPEPKHQIKSTKYLVLRPSTFKFTVIGNTCDILDKAIDRYSQLILMQIRGYRERNDATNNDVEFRTFDEEQGNLNEVIVHLKEPCDILPFLGMDESYSFDLTETDARIEARTVWGILRGLESFSQLLYVSEDGKSLLINETSIEDQPRYSHRGLLVDTSRHFISLDVLKQILDGMAYNKLNVFHWHIVDDHSFPYQSVRFPELSEKGAYNKRFVYSQRDVVEIIEYARLRGIRVMPEFDTPGHTASWGASHPEILTACGPPYTGRYGPINPTKDETYVFLRELFQELVKVFPDKYQHLGGDEVGFECWQSNDEIKQFMKERGIANYRDLEEFYIQKLIDQVTALNASSVVWQEVFENGVRLPKGTVVHVWTGDRRRLLNQITRQRLPALLSSCWYLDHLSTGGDWKKFYDCDPEDFWGNEDQKKLVYGGEACMWSEVVDDSNIVQRIFPRASATAEKLWSPFYVNDVEAAKRRLEEHYCRMRNRGIQAQPPNGPGLCL
jgi:hexosaminidase